jgi:hypothetical protein
LGVRHDRSQKFDAPGQSKRLLLRSSDPMNAPALLRWEAVSGGRAQYMIR